LILWVHGIPVFFGHRPPMKDKNSMSSIEGVVSHEQSALYENNNHRSPKHGNDNSYPRLPLLSNRSGIMSANKMKSPVA